MAIPAELVPVHIEDMVREANTFSVDTWRQVVGGWAMVTVKFAIIAKMQTEQARIDMLKKGGGPQFENIIADAEKSGDESAKVLAAVFCISEEALARLFQALDAENKLGDLPRRERRKLMSARSAN